MTFYIYEKRSTVFMRFIKNLVCRFFSLFFRLRTKKPRRIDGEDDYLGLEIYDYPTVKLQEIKDRRFKPS